MLKQNYKGMFMFHRITNCVLLFVCLFCFFNATLYGAAYGELQYTQLTGQHKIEK